MDLRHSGTWSRIPRCALPSVRCYSSRAPGSIMIVEDEALVRASGVGLFVDAGFRAIEAVNSDEALEVLDAGSKVQVLFTDVNLPGMIDGLALARKVNDRWPHIGIIIVSGRSTPQPHGACGQACPRNDGRKTSAAFRAACGIFAKMAWLTDTVVPWGPLETSTRASSCCASALTMLVPSPAFA